MARLTHGASLKKVVLAMVLGVGIHHARVQGHATPLLAIGDGRGSATAPAPAPAPLKYEPENTRNDVIAAWAVRAMHELTKLCHDKECALAPSDDDRYVVTTETCATAADQDEERDPEGSEYFKHMRS